jgi:hypothetical protein
LVNNEKEQNNDNVSQMDIINDNAAAAEIDQIGYKQLTDDEARAWAC